MSDYIAGVFGLIGTAIGAGTTLIPPLISDRHKQSVAAATAVRDAQVTALLLVDDLDIARRRLRGAYRHDNDRFWSADFELPLATWAASRAQIAHSLPPELWDVVARAFRELLEIEKSASAARGSDPAARPQLNAGSAAWLKRAADDMVTPAITALAGFAKAPAPREPEAAVALGAEPRRTDQLA